MRGHCSICATSDLISEKLRRFWLRAKLVDLIKEISMSLDNMSPKKEVN